MNEQKWTKEHVEDRLIQTLQPDTMQPAYKAGWGSGWIAATFTLRDLVKSGQFSFEEALEAVTEFWSTGPLNDYSNDVSVHREPHDNPKEFQEMPKAQQEHLTDWIQRTLHESQDLEPRAPSSYYLKHVYQRATGVYVTNGEFKGAMIACGFLPTDESAQTPVYRIQRINEFAFEQEPEQEEEQDS